MHLPVWHVSVTRCQIRVYRLGCYVHLPVWDDMHYGACHLSWCIWKWHASDMHYGACHLMAKLMHLTWYNWCIWHGNYFSRALFKFSNEKRRIWHGTAYCICSVNSPISILNRWSSFLGLFCHVLVKRDQWDWDWRVDSMTLQMQQAVDDAVTSRKASWNPAGVDPIHWKPVDIDPGSLLSGTHEKCALVRS